MNLEDLLQSRRSINAYKPEKPEEDLILKAIDFARWAPNHHLTEPWRFYLLGKETSQAIIELNTRLVNNTKGPEAAAKKQKKWLSIPGWLVVTMPTTTDRLLQQEDYAACSCAVQNLALYLWQQGIGIKWTTGDVMRHPEFYEQIWVDPELETVVGLICYGYPKEIPESYRKPLEEIIVRLP